MKVILLSLLALLLLSTACNSKQGGDETADAQDSTKNLAGAGNEITPAEPEADPAPEATQSSDGSMVATGTIKDAVVDPFPMGNLVFVTEEGETLNIYYEATTVEMQEIENRIGQQATIKYRLKKDKAVMDVLLGDETIMGDIDHSPDWKMLEGTLIAKEENRGGDLPGFFELKLKDGSTESFEAFLTDAMISYSGKDVFVFYDARESLVLENIR